MNGLIRIDSIRDRNGDDLMFDPIRQHQLHAWHCQRRNAVRRAQAERTNIVFRQAVEKRPALPQRRQRNRFVAALMAACAVFQRELAR